MGEKQPVIVLKARVPLDVLTRKLFFLHGYIRYKLSFDHIPFSNGYNLMPDLVTNFERPTAVPNQIFFSLSSKMLVTMFELRPILYSVLFITAQPVLSTRVLPARYKPTQCSPGKAPSKSYRTFGLSSLPRNTHSLYAILFVSLAGGLLCRRRYHDDHRVRLSCPDQMRHVRCGRGRSDILLRRIRVVEHQVRRQVNHLV